MKYEDYCSMENLLKEKKKRVSPFSNVPGIRSAVQPAASKRLQLLELHEDLTRKAYATMEIKNNAYATTADPFRNFRIFGLLGVLVRLSDKLSRLQVFVENGFDGVADESVQDTVEDGINYLILFEGLRKELSKESITSQPTEGHETR